MAHRSSLRASDADRERVADRLRHATAEGRLLAHELEERLAAALRARTYGELDAVVADLPSDHAVQGSSAELTHWVRPAVALAVAIPLALVAVAVVIAMAAFVLSGVFAVWMLWMVVGWWLLGSRHDDRRRRRQQHHGRPPLGLGGGRRTAHRPGSWL